MKYSVSSEIVTVTAKMDDGYGLTSRRADLEAKLDFNNDIPETISKQTYNIPKE